MKKLFETSKIKELDQYTIDKEQITSVDLVERAATVFVNEFRRRFSSTQNKIYVFAGQGNNGADALAIARLLSENGYDISAYLLNPTNRLSTDCEENKRRLQSVENVKFTEIVSQFEPPVLEKHDIVIDGIFGSGLNRPLEKGFAAMVDYINSSESTVVSIDIPSGLFGENNNENNPEHIIQADLTLTFEFPKISFLLPESADFVGEWKALPIGLVGGPDVKTPYGLITDEDIASLIRPRDKFSHKGDFGHALLIAGSIGKMGAAVLAAKGCLRSGAGLLTVRVPERGEAIMQTSLPEAMVSLDASRDYIASLPEDMDKYSAIGIGPGLGISGYTVALVTSLISKAHGIPMVLDADALNIISENTELMHQLPEGTILTPHPKEFDRLAGVSENSYERLQKARSIANEQKLCIILKGAYTAVCTPNGQVFFNTSGNPGMATAGSGDVLTGVILGLLAQGYRPEKAAVIGTYIHGLAGDRAASSFSEESLIAGDIANMLGSSFKQMNDLLYS